MGNWFLPATRLSFVKLHITDKYLQYLIYRKHENKNFELLQNGRQKQIH